MADSVSQITTKISDKSNCMNVIQKRTTETLRLGETDKLSVQSAASSMNVQGQKKKTSSFQITSVTIVDRQSNDGGEDSADDLDESHTEDTSEVIDSSKVTDVDNETPSYSEDTFSKCEDVFINPMPAGLSAPVIPTSSQYGLAIVPGSGRNNQNVDTNIPTEVTVTVAENMISIPVINVKPGERDHEQWQNRFKVVKIESTEPFKRGRWLCLDFLDHTTVQSQTTLVKEEAGSGNSSTASSLHIPGENPPTENPLTLVTEELDVNAVSDSNTVSKPANASVHDPASAGLVQQPQPILPVQPSYTGVSQGPSEFPASHVSHPSGLKQSQTSSLAPQSVSQQPQVSVPEYSIAAGQSVGLPNNIPSTGQGQSIGQNLGGQQPTLAQPPISSQTQTIPPQNQISQQPSQATETSINTKIPSTQLQQEFTNVPKQQTTQGVTVLPLISQPSVQGTSIPTTVQTSIPVAAQSSIGTSSMVSSVGMQNQPSNYVQQSPQTSISKQTVTSNSPQLNQGQGTTALHGSQGPVVSASGQSIVSSIPQAQPVTTQPHTPHNQHPGGPDTSFAQTRPQPVNPQSNLDPEGQAVHINMEAPQQLLNSLQEKMSTSSEVTVGGEDSESTSGTSTVAIDNKIEQAMDLVKSHLMFAVREEVEVLKERISELMDRIQQLEYENTILKSHASQETLAQLSQPPPKSQPPGGPPSSTS